MSKDTNHTSKMDMNISKRQQLVSSHIHYESNRDGESGVCLVIIEQNVHPSHGKSTFYAREINEHSIMSRQSRIESPLPGNKHPGNEGYIISGGGSDIHDNWESRNDSLDNDINSDISPFDVDIIGDCVGDDDHNTQDPVGQASYIEVQNHMDIEIFMLATMTKRH